MSNDLLRKAREGRENALRAIEGMRRGDRRDLRDPRCNPVFQTRRAREHNIFI